MRPDLTRRWIVANTVAMAVIATASMFSYAARTFLAVETPDAPFAAKAAYVAMETIIIGGGTTAVYASLIGRVLTLIVPALPWRRWMTVHVVVGLCHPHVAAQHLHQREVRCAAFPLDKFGPDVGGIKQFTHM